MPYKPEMTKANLEAANQAAYFHQSGKSPYARKSGEAGLRGTAMRMWQKMKPDEIETFRKETAKKLKEEQK
jgi:hypothetical protein